LALDNEAGLGKGSNLNPVDELFRNRLPCLVEIDLVSRPLGPS